MLDIGHDYDKLDVIRLCLMLDIGLDYALLGVIMLWNYKQVGQNQLGPHKTRPIYIYFTIIYAYVFISLFEHACFYHLSVCTCACMFLSVCLYMRMYLSVYLPLDLSIYMYLSQVAKG